MMSRDGEFCGLFFKNISSNHSQNKSELIKPDGVDLYNQPLITFPCNSLGTLLLKMTVGGIFCTSTEMQLTEVTWSFVNIVLVIAQHPTGAITGA